MEMTQVCAVRSPVAASRYGQVEEGGDCYVPSGRIGELDLKCGCYTTYAVFRLAACDVAARGLESGVRALLATGQTTVREFLRHAYGCSLGKREYFTPSHMTGAQADARDFLRILGRAVGAIKRSAPRTKTTIGV
jgi:hypothetical protein